ncbi:MAG: redox-regulated ATPase YchF [bacterium]
MGIKAGLVGLPNVGKSTLFNALTKSCIPAENYPFCTVDPHVAITNVPDEKLEKLTAIFNSAKTIPTTVQFVDIAGLVKGAAQGEGLGNQFLSNIMGVDLILHILRCFEDPNITHVHNEINPIDDFETVISELMLKDLESVEKREEKLKATLIKAKSKQLSANEIKTLENEQELLKQAKVFLNKGNFQELQKLINEKKEVGIETIPLLSSKNFLIIANLSEDDFAGKNYTENKYYKDLLNKFGPEKVIPVSAKIEFELAQLDDEEKVEMLESLDIQESGLDNIIKKAYKSLNLITFFTCGPKESHAWSIKKGKTIHQASGEIHSDIQRGFICAEVYNYDDLIKFKTEHAVKEAGKLKIEGKDYIMQEGDIIHVRFNI